MAVYAIGDLQGCYNSFQELLGRIHFDPQLDRLWIAGDLVNRGPENLAVLRSLKVLGDQILAVLGNHDLYALARWADLVPKGGDDTLADLFESERAAELMDWLRAQPLVYYDENLNWALVHAALHPDWSVEQAVEYSSEIQAGLSGPEWRGFLAKIWTKRAPVRWDECQDKWQRYQFMVSVFTRARLVSQDGTYHWSSRSPVDAQNYSPWHAVYLQKHPEARIVCGHWATQGLVVGPRLLALDSGCVWGESLSAARLDTAMEPTPIWQVSCPIHALPDSA